jgi:hypothetical protein
MERARARGARGDLDDAPQIAPHGATDPDLSGLRREVSSAQGKVDGVVANDGESVSGWAIDHDDPVAKDEAIRGGSAAVSLNVRPSHRRVEEGQARGREGTGGPRLPRGAAAG